MGSGRKAEACLGEGERVMSAQGPKGHEAKTLGRVNQSSLVEFEKISILF
jgi:hypothetical protein